MKKAIRNQYSELGVEAYYEQHGADYENPHFEQIKALLHQNQEKIDYTHVLDLCCGSGEVSEVVLELGAKQVTGLDPFTGIAFKRRIGQEALSLSFQDIIRGKLEGQFSSIICSFAMHLCPEKQLYPLVMQLFQHASQLVILTPHKRPDLSALDDVHLAFEDFALTERGKKVRLMSYVPRMHE